MENHIEFCPQLLMFWEVIIRPFSGKKGFRHFFVCISFVGLELTYGFWGKIKLSVNMFVNAVKTQPTNHRCRDTLGQPIKYHPQTLSTNQISSTDTINQSNIIYRHINQSNIIHRHHQPINSVGSLTRQVLVMGDHQCLRRGRPEGCKASDDVEQNQWVQ